MRKLKMKTSPERRHSWLRSPVRLVLHHYRSALHDAGLCLRSTTLCSLFLLFALAFLSPRHSIGYPALDGGEFSASEELVLTESPSEAGALMDYRNAVAFMQHRNPRLTEGESQEILRCITAAAKEYSLPKGMLFFLADVESDYRLDAVSNKGALGLMQVNPFVWVHKQHPDNLVSQGVIRSIGDLFTAEGSVRAAAYILRHYVDQALAQGVDNPTGHALRRYLGGSGESHPLKFRESVGDYVMFSYNLGQKELASTTTSPTEGREG